MFIVADLVSLNTISFSIKHVNNENSSVFFTDKGHYKSDVSGLGDSMFTSNALMRRLSLFSDWLIPHNWHTRYKPMLY